MDAVAGAGPTDTVVVLLAGHGEQGALGTPTAGRYLVLPTNRAGRGIADAGWRQNLVDWSAI